MSNEILEKKKFTQTAVLFSMTGHIFFSGDASEEYYQQGLSEIKEDAVYRHVMGTVPDTMKKSLWEMYDADTLDVDPILKKYLCMKLPKLAIKLDEIKSLTFREAIKWLEKTCLDNSYIELSQIKFDEVTMLATEVHDEIEKEQEKYSQL